MTPSYSYNDASIKVERDFLAERTIDLLGLADVPRWSVVKVLRPQSVAEHSFAVAVITMELISRLSIHSLADPTTLGAVLWAICHDAPETYTGDIDGLLKREHPNVKSAINRAENEAFPWYGQMRDGMGSALLALVKVADCIESIVYLREWGKGARADDVMRELRRILFDQYVPVLAILIGDKDSHTIEAVVRVLDHSTTEAGSYQFRRSLRFDDSNGGNDSKGEANGTDTGSGSGTGTDASTGAGAGAGTGSNAGRASTATGSYQGENRGDSGEGGEGGSER